MNAASTLHHGPLLPTGLVRVSTAPSLPVYRADCMTPPVLPDSYPDYLRTLVRTHAVDNRAFSRAFCGYSAALVQALLGKPLRIADTHALRAGHVVPLRVARYHVVWITNTRVIRVAAPLRCALLLQVRPRCLVDCSQLCQPWRLRLVGSVGPIPSSPTDPTTATHDSADHSSSWSQLLLPVDSLTLVWLIDVVGRWTLYPVPHV